MGSAESSVVAIDENDTLAKVPKPYGVTSKSAHLKLNTSHRCFYDGIVSLIQDNKYSDLVVICGSDRYPVHRAIVCPRSSWFEYQCTEATKAVDYSSPGSPMKVRIDPSECESHILAAVLTFLYTLDYSSSGEQLLTFRLPEAEDDEEGYRDDTPAERDGEDLILLSDNEESETIFTPPSKSSHEPSSSDLAPSASVQSDPGETPNELVFETQMYLAGQSFGIPSLCDVAKEKFEKRLRAGPWNVEMIPCIREVYRHQSNPNISKLKEDVVKSANSRFRVLKVMEGWDDLVMDFPEFGAEMLRRL